VRAGPNSKLSHVANPTSLGAPVQPGCKAPNRHCSTRIAPDRDITGNWRDVDEPWASLPAVPPGRTRAPAATAGFSIQERELIEETEAFATAKPDVRLVKLLIRARQFNATLLGSDGVPFAALAKRLVRLSYLAPDITEANPRRPSAARSDRRQAARALASAAWLARAADRARLCLSRTELRAWSRR